MWWEAACGPPVPGAARRCDQGGEELACATTGAARGAARVRQRVRALRGLEPLLFMAVMVVAVAVAGDSLEGCGDTRLLGRGPPGELQGSPVSVSVSVLRALRAGLDSEHSESVSENYFQSGDTLEIQEGGADDGSRSVSPAALRSFGASPASPIVEQSALREEKVAIPCPPQVHVCMLLALIGPVR
jgi:hypothetical protein